MFGKTISKRFYIHSLLSSAACVAALSFASSEAEARGLFAERTAVPAIEINLDAIDNLKAARDAAAEEAARQEALAQEKADAEAVQAETESQNNDESIALSDNEQVSDESSLDEPSERLPIVIKKSEAPVAPMYKGDKVVSEVKDTPPQPTEQRTVASMFRDLFYGDEQQNEPKLNESVEIEHPVDASTAEVTAEAPQEEASRDVIEVEEIEDAPSVDVVNNNDFLDQTLDDSMADESNKESRINHVEVNSPTESAEEDGEGFFGNFLNAFKNDQEEKKKAIQIERPEAPTEEISAPSIFADSESDFKVVKDGKELLDDGKEENLVSEEVSNGEQDIASLPATLPTQDKDVQIILPNKVDKSEDVYGFVPSPKPNPKRAEVTEKKIASISAEKVVTPALKQPAETTAAVEKEAVEEVNVMEDSEREISSLAEKDLPQPLEQKEISNNESLPIHLGEKEIAVAESDEVVEEQTENPLLDEPYYTETKPSIPVPAEVMERDLGEEEELVATPVILDEKPSQKPSFFQKAKGWFGLNNKVAEEEEIITKDVVTPPSNDMQDIAVDEEKELPASLPEPIDLAALEQKLESLAPKEAPLPEKLEVMPEEKVIKPIEEPKLAKELKQKVEEKKEEALVVLPNEIIDEIAEESVIADDEPVNVATLSESVGKAIQETTSAQGEQGSLLMLEFLPTQTELLGADKQKIMALVNQIKQDDRKRLKIKSYASQVDDSPGAARRVSLQRAIAIRSVMVQNGIDGVRINVQAMGNAVESGPEDRADILIIQD